MYLFCRDSATLFSLAHYMQFFPAFVCWAAEEVQGCAGGGFRSDPHLPRIHRIARATARSQRPELPERAGGAQLAQGPALAAGPARAARAIRGARATPAPAPSRTGSCRNPLARAGPRLGGLGGLRSLAQNERPRCR